MTKSKIEWTDETLNIVTGCREISPGCDNCYARKMHKRLQLMGQPKYQNDWHEVTLHPKMFEVPYRWTKPCMVFVCSMSDLFHKDVPTQFILEFIEVCRELPQHTFQLLTKRADRLIEIDTVLRRNWPDNIWLGVTVEHEGTQWRIDKLAQTAAKIKWVSIEPFIEALNHTRLLKQGKAIDWYVIGGESGSHDKIRKMYLIWVHKIIDVALIHQTPVFYKQGGSLTPCTQYHRKCKNTNKGCKLFSGKLWHQFPEAKQND